MKKLLTRLSSVLLLVTIVISAISMSGHVFAQTDSENQNNIVDIETDENQSTKAILQSSEESLEPNTDKAADSEQTKSSEEIAQKETTENIESEENTTDSEAQQNSEENSNEQPESSLFSDRMRPSDTLTAGSLEIEDTRSLSKYDTINTLKDFTYTVSFSNLTPDKIYKYQTTSNTKYFTAESDGTATLQIVLRANQKVTFSDIANVSYKITTSENAASAASYTAIAGDGALKKASDQAEKGSTLSSETETVSATSGTVFTFKHQFYYNFIIDSIVKSASTISPSAHLVFPASMNGQLIQIEGTGSSVAVGDDAAADMPIVNGQKMILSNISSSDIDQMYDSSELISIPDIPGYTSSLTKHIEDNGDITANINYKEYGYQIIYHGNGADDELTETVVDDDIQNTYSFSTKDTSNSHYLYVDLTRNGNTINYKITLSPIGVMYLRNREGTITVNGVEKSVMLNAPSGKISEIDSGSFEINDTGDTYFSCRVEAKKTHIMTSNWTADFGNNKLGTRTKYEVSKIIDELTYSEVKNLHANPYKKTGYLFAGWNTKADGTGIGYTETQEISQLAAADKDEDSIDLYAQWIPVQYSVKYSGNGATGGSMSNSSYIYDQTGTLAQNQFEKNYTLTFKYNYSDATDSTFVSKYKFNGWNGSDGKKYADKAAVKNLTSKNNDVITMTARWAPASVTLPSPSRDGYTFDGWYSAASGGNKVGSAGDSITPESNETYYAHWTANNYTYKIRYISSSGKLLGEDTVSGNFDSERTVTPPSKNGYTTPAVQKVVFDSISAKTITFTYEPVKYSIMYDLQGGSATGNPASYTIESSAITMNAPSKSKHDFTGWSGTGILGKQTTVTIPSGSTGNKTYTANWHSNEVTYTVKYVSSSGLSLGTSSITGTIGTSSKVSAPSKNGYTVPATQTVAFEDASKTVTFTYVPIEYTITCDVNGGNPLSNQKTAYNIESSAITLPLPTCKGMEFTGWTGSNGTDPQKTVTIAKGSTGNRSYKANWSVNNYVLDLNGILDGSSNGGITKYGTADVYINGVLKADDVSDFYLEIPYGSTYEIKDIKATAGHVYAGTDQALKGTMGTSRVNIALKFNTKKTTVNFMRNYNSSDTTKSSETYTYGVSDQNFSNRGYSRAGYTLLGWSESQTATKETYPVDCGVASSWIDGHYPSINLYAVWSKNSYSISYNLNGGTVSGNPETYQVDTAEITLKNPTKTGYTFLGWSGTGIIGTSKEVKIPKGSTENRSYTANWKINQYDIVIKGDKGTESINYGGKTYPLTATKSVTIHADYGTNTDVKYTVKKGFHIVSETGQSMSNTQQTWTNNANKEGSTGGQTWTTCAFTRTITVNTAQNKFVLSFGDSNGGTSGSQNATFGNGEKVTFNAAKKPGYTFKNWNTKADGTGKSYPDGVAVDDIEASNGETVNMYAIYRPNVLTFHFYANGGDTYRNTPDEKTHNVTADEKANKTAIALTQNVECMKYDETVNTYGIVDAQRLSRTGYKSTNKWHANTVTGVLLDANNGVYAKTQDIAEAAGILQKLEDGDTDINLYADWTPNTYILKFDANGGAGNPVTQKMTYDKDTVLTPVSYTRTKHRFLYWTENADGSGKKYADKASVKNLTATANGTVTLYAQWEKLTDLKIMNTVSGNMGSRAKDFEFSTAFPACFQNRKFTIIKGDGTKKTVTIGADGAVKFSLKHGETFTFTDLDPEQINAIKNLGNRDIIESDYTAEGYTTTHAASVEDDGTLVITYSNAKNSGVPTGIHNSSGTKWMMIFGFVGMIFAISSFFRKSTKNHNLK